jgi:hypothetical protein
MPKLKDFLRKVADGVKISDEKFEELLKNEALEPFELSDDFMTAFNVGYLTRSRAENDEHIIRKITEKARSSAQKEIFDNIDEKIEGLLQRVPQEKALEIKGEKSTFKRMELLSEALEMINSAKTTTEKDIQKIEKEWADKNKAIVENHKLELKKVQDQARTDKLNSALKNKIFAYNFSDAYASMKPATADIIINQLRSSQQDGKPVVFEHDDATGSIFVRQETEGGLRDIYPNGNDKLTIDTLLDPLVQPFVKKADTTPGGGGATHKPVTPPADRSKMTIHEMMKADAALNGQ